ncbi:hypothetical protein PACTADRAFT_35525 [Pachysolen tannophilus NRRL Y-2460]|uniref:Phosphoribosyltransferase domain-containing protein n=1 Tax=Pachysolen tannophilus NRRL Y-2460 TaxID=669874 RepID=A0A1E4TPU1_PACTA|nr:hypothetical protein PACTADRAFT_35525 [Pachysolen tannophilus NRRL Y-2460]
MGEENKIYISYNHIHKMCQDIAPKIKEFKPDLMIAIGGGGFIPARMLRTCLKEAGKPTLRIYAIILSLYEDLGTVSTAEEAPGVQVKRVQWIDYDQSGVDLINKNVLIIDEVDDTRKTLHYALSELEKDLAKQCKEKGGDPKNTKFGVFVCHNKLKEKKNNYQTISHKRVDISQKMFQILGFVILGKLMILNIIKKCANCKVMIYKKQGTSS